MSAAFVMYQVLHDVFENVVSITARVVAISWSRRYIRVEVQGELDSGHASIGILGVRVLTGSHGDKCSRVIFLNEPCQSKGETRS